MADNVSHGRGGTLLSVVALWSSPLRIENRRWQHGARRHPVSLCDAGIFILAHAFHTAMPTVRLSVKGQLEIKVMEHIQQAYVKHSP